MKNITIPVEYFFLAIGFLAGLGLKFFAKLVWKLIEKLIDKYIKKD